MKKSLANTFRLQLLTDSETLFNVKYGIHKLKKKRMIDVNAEREASNDGIKNDIIPIRRKYNPAGSMTRNCISSEICNRNREKSIALRGISISKIPIYSSAYEKRKVLMFKQYMAV